MNGLLKLRERGIRFFKEYETWFRIIGKFIGMMLVFNCINTKLGYMQILCQTPVVILLSLICSIIPSGFVLFLAFAVTAAHMMALNTVIGILAIFVMLIVYLLFLKYTTRQTLVLLAIPVLMQWNLHFAVPVIAGVLFTPYAFIPAAAGMFLVKFLGNCVDAAPLAGTVKAIDYEGILTAFIQVFTRTFEDRSIILFAVCAAAAVAFGYLLSRLSFDYSWYAGLALAAVCEVAAAYGVTSLPGFTVDSTAVITGAVIGFAVGCIIQFFRLMVDYSRKQYVQFEDEEYYYYVKAIPKFLTPVPNRERDDNDLQAVISEGKKAARNMRSGIGRLRQNSKDKPKKQQNVESKNRK